MAETEIPVQGYLEAPSWIPAASQMKYRNDGLTQIGVQADDDTTLTHIEQKQCNHGHALTDQVDNITAPTVQYFYYGNQIHRFTGPDGMVHVTFSSLTNVSVYCFTNRHP